MDWSYVTKDFLLIIIIIIVIIIAAAVREPEANERGSSLIGKKLHYRWFSRYVIAAMLVDGKQKIAH